MRLGHKGKTARYRFFVVPGDGPALQGMLDIELLVILKIMCEVVGGQQEDRKFYSQRIKPTSTPNCKANRLGDQFR